jgi:hypothetical protein
MKSSTGKSKTSACINVRSQARGAGDNTYSTANPARQIQFSLKFVF